MVTTRWTTCLSKVSIKLKIVNDRFLTEKNGTISSEVAILNKINIIVRQNGSNLRIEAFLQKVTNSQQLAGHKSSVRITRIKSSKKHVGTSAAMLQTSFVKVLTWTSFFSCKKEWIGATGERDHRINDNVRVIEHWLHPISLCRNWSPNVGCMSSSWGGGVDVGKLLSLRASVESTITS